MYLPVADYAFHSPIKYRQLKKFGGLYTARVLACSLPEDIVQLDPRLRPFYPVILEHFESVGLKTASTVLYSNDPLVAGNFPNHQLSVYTFTDAFHAVRPDESRLQATELCNNKNSFIAYCTAANVPVPRTHVSQHGPLHELSAIQLPAYVKAARSAAGVSIYRVENQVALAKALTRVGSDYQVQQEVPDVTAFISVQYRADDTGVHHIATTTQLMEGFRHMGNIYPCEYDPRPITDSLAALLQAEGLRDIFAFDIAVAADGRMFILECNARWTASTYPTMVAERLGVKTWTACTIDTHLERLQDMQLGGLLYDPSTRHGAVIIHFGHLAADQASARKIGFLLIGSPEEQAELHIRLEERLRGRAVKPSLKQLSHTR